MTHKGWCVVKNQANKQMIWDYFVGTCFSCPDLVLETKDFKLSNLLSISECIASDEEILWA